MSPDETRLFEHLLAPELALPALEHREFSLEESAGLASVALQVFDLLSRGHFRGLLEPIPMGLTLYS